jgi:hypothetical protein
LGYVDEILLRGWCGRYLGVLYSIVKHRCGLLRVSAEVDRGWALRAVETSNGMFFVHAHSYSLEMYNMLP